MNRHEKIEKYIVTRANALIHEKELTIKTIFDYTFSWNKGTAFEYFDDDEKYRKISYAQVKKNIFRYASVLSKEIGVDKIHNVVVLKLNNSPEWVEMYYAILMAGFKPLLVNAKTSKDGVNNLIKQTSAVAVVTDDPFSYDVMKLRTDIVVRTKPDKNFVPVWENEVVFCSSGTTGDVKLVVFDGENFCHQIASCLEMPKQTDDLMYPKYMGKIKILGMIPFHHIFGFVATFLWYSTYGSVIVFPKSMNSAEIQDLCINKKVTHIYCVPLFFESVARQYLRQIDMAEEPIKGYLEKLLKMNLENGEELNPVIVKKIQNKFLGSNIKMCISGGGYISQETMDVINGMGYPLYNGFGMTEIGVASVELSGNIKDRLKCSVGKPFHNVEYKIENGENIAELLVKSPLIHKKEIIGGVLQNASLDADGYFHTGDIFEADKTGRFYIKGRCKDVIINANGENIFPDEIELYFKDIANVINYSVLGVKKPDNKQAEDVCLVLQIPSKSDKKLIGAILDEIDVRTKKLPLGVQIDRVLFTISPLPMANNLKVKRNVIKDALASKSPDYFTGVVEEEKVEEKHYDAQTVIDIVTPIRKIFSKVILLPESKIRNNSHWINDLGGDSMNFFQIISEIEDYFKVKIPDEKYICLTTVDNFVDMILELKKGEESK